MKAPVDRFSFFRLESGKLIVALVVALLIGLIAVAGSFIYTTYQSRNNNAYQSLVGEQQLLSQRISTNALEASRGMAAPGARLNNFISRFDETLRVFRNGDLGSDLPPIGTNLREPLAALEREWRNSRELLALISNGLPTIRSISELGASADQRIPRLIEESNQVISLLIKNGASRQLVAIASYQLTLIQRMSHSISVIISGGSDTLNASEQLQQDLVEFGEVINGMLGLGANPLQITPVTDPKVIDGLQRTQELYEVFARGVDEINRLAPGMSEVGDAAHAVAEQGTLLLSSTTTLREALNHSTAGLGLIYLVGAGGVALVILSLIALAYVYWLDSERRIQATSEQNRRNQRAILRLLDEMTNLADGDLSAHATVSEDITGAIADSVNYAIDALRSLVATINHTSVQVSSAADRTQSTAARLADASNLQTRQITSTSSSINEMAETMTRMSESAADSQSVALNSVAIANKGAETVRRNIQAMDSIREQIQETSKRIKRLGESSQEIGDIIGLINEIADRTNILALNAAIQASTAGEAGRGFAVVADEVQRLAERAGDATKQVEALVKAIQVDTGEAVASMEQSTSGVVSGARLAEDAGSALTEVETVSQQLAALIQDISREASQQADIATTLSSNMSVLREITVQTSSGTTETANSIGKLTALSNELRESVAGFRLPDEEENMLDSIVMPVNLDE